mmetsp:Transcript_54671/g.150586  ORF Transcript_54671/g.150586 Transcript_54671/m.150586 type:complete len:213 (+) Transcript_54671:341-979(+)
MNLCTRPTLFVRYVLAFACVREECTIMTLTRSSHRCRVCWQVLKPVSLTMLLASVVVVYIRSEEGDGGGQSLDQYTIYDESDESGDTTSVRLGKSMVNALIIVCGLAAATFCIVCLYKYRFMKLLIGYMMLSSCILLGMMGGLVWWTLLEAWQVPLDCVTFLLVCYNFAVVGVVAIFYQKGIPMVITQGYLVCTSVLMAWQLSKFEEWTGRM